MKKIILGVTASISAYKACEVISILKKRQYDIEVFLTPDASRFVTAATFGALIGKEVIVDEFNEDPYKIQHIHTVKDADCFAIIPASANTIAKVAHGICDNTLTSAFLAATCPKLIAPAMNVHMWENEITQDNIESLRKRNVTIVTPQSGQLACGDYGSGKLASVEDICDMIEYCINPKPLLNKNILVSAGPTQEAIDPVRFLTNHSTGKMGYEIAKAARNLGGTVTLVSGPVNLDQPLGMETILVKSADDMYETITDLYEDQDYVIMSAAVGDYKCHQIHDQKIKKSSSSLTLELSKNKDILETLGQNKTHQTLCGFAMETENLMGYAKTKFEKKNCDLLVANHLFTPGAGFAVDTNKVTFITKHFTEQKELMTKEQLAYEIIFKLIKIKGE